ncbi:hypothetical protein SAMN05877962_106144 [Alloalcanivorax xenomutans]|uniref:hypothetical protein n=1 Tax=Alloalcanivorax xenomutans TaxID=1094342 RepID=UPI000BDD8C7A|nr:hypothetical protein [Alloalcanivorax xenomutans]SOC04529.1 hypothetical protein SAMN05877962_106144 [Alloalcanivorax xenomutans]
MQPDEIHPLEDRLLYMVFLVKVIQEVDRLMIKRGGEDRKSEELGACFFVLPLLVVGAGAGAALGDGAVVEFDVVDVVNG